MTAALAEPVKPVGAGWVARLSLNLVGMWIAWYAPLQVLLGLHAAALAPDHKEFVFGLTTGLGALVSLVVNPLVGALSDRTTSRFGRRVPWIAAGAVVAAAGLGLLALASTIALFVIGWCLAQAGLNTMLGAQTAFLPDQVPHRQRATVSGVVSVAATVGILAGTGLAATFGSGRPIIAYVVCAVIVLVCTVPNVVFSADAVLASQSRPALGGYWISPRKYPDFGWAWLSRLLINLGNAVGTVYLLFYLKDAVGYADPPAGVFILTLIYAIAVVATSVVAGRISDRLGRRKILVVAAGVGIAVALVLLAAQTWTFALAGAAVLGIAYGVYTSVDLALVTEVLPTSFDRAKDLGVIAIAQTLPNTIATVLAGIIVTMLGGYFTLYVVAAGFALLGAALVTRIRGVA